MGQKKKIHIPNAVIVMVVVVLIAFVILLAYENRGLNIAAGYSKPAATGDSTGIADNTELFKHLSKPKASTNTAPIDIHRPLRANVLQFNVEHINNTQYRILEYLVGRLVTHEAAEANRTGDVSVNSRQRHIEWFDMMKKRYNVGSIPNMPPDVYPRAVEWLLTEVNLRGVIVNCQFLTGFEHICRE